MRRLFPLALAILVGLVVAMGCIIDNRPRGRSCPAGWRWHDGGCVKVQKHHKGKHKHRKHKHRRR
jgi:hypothetical protein